MPYHVRITTDTDGLINDAKPYPTLAAAMQVAGLSLKTGGATTAWIEDDDGNGLCQHRRREKALRVDLSSN